MTIRVGIAGANAERGWALDAHLEALRALPQFEVVAVSARTREIADAAKAKFGAARAYADSLELARDPGVDLLVVSVKAPEHRPIILAGLAAGKHVFSEWPLGRDLAEAEEMAAAIPPGVHTICGMQALLAPAIRQAAELIREGRIGKPQVLRAYTSAAGWSTSALPHYAYLQDKRNGATLETIGGGHILAPMEELVGRFTEVDARNSILNPRVPIVGTGEIVERTCSDHMFVLGKHDSGCVSTLEVIGGTTERVSLFDVVGESGWIRVTGITPGTCQIAPLKIEASFPLDPMPTPVAPQLKGPPANVAEVYAVIARDLETGEHTAPDFARAAGLTRLLDAIDAASTTGIRQTVAA